MTAERDYLMVSDTPREKGEAKLIELIRWLFAGWDHLLPPPAVRLPEKPVPISEVEHLFERPAPAPIPAPVKGDPKDTTIKILLDLLIKQIDRPKPEPRELTAQERKKIYDRSRKRILPPDWPERRQAVFERDGFQCVYCDALDCELHCDHVIPLSRGGSHELDNLVTACGPCNIKKNNRSVDEFTGGGG